MNRFYQGITFFVLCVTASNLCAQTQMMDVAVSSKKINKVNETMTTIVVNDKAAAAALAAHDGDDVLLLDGNTQHEPWQQFVTVGETVRLRFTSAGAQATFKIKISHAPLGVNTTQAGSVNPLLTKDIVLVPGQSVEVPLTIVDPQPYYIYAESGQGFDYALGVLNSTDDTVTNMPTMTPLPVPAALGVASITSASVHEAVAKTPAYMTNDWQYGHDFGRNIDQLTTVTMFGRGDNKLQFYMDSAQLDQGTVSYANVDIFAWHALNDSWAIKGGANYVYRPIPYWQPGVGIEGSAPFSIDSNIRAYWHDGSGALNLDISRNTTLIGNLSFITEITIIAATQALDSAQIGQGFNSISYTLGPSWQLFNSLALQLQYQYTRSYGNTADLLRADGSAITQSLLTFGLEAVF